MVKKRFFLFLSIIVLLVTGVAICCIVLPEKNCFDLENVEYILLINGDSGEEAEVKDPDQLQCYISILEKIKYRRVDKNPSHVSGGRFTIVIKETNETIRCTYTRKYMDINGDRYFLTTESNKLMQEIISKIPQ